MADKKITDLFEITVPNTSDVIPIASAGLTRKVTLDNFVQQSTYSTKKISNLTLQTSLNPTDQLPLVTGSGDVRKITGNTLASRTQLEAVSSSLLPVTTFQSATGTFLTNTNRNITSYSVPESPSFGVFTLITPQLDKSTFVGSFKNTLSATSSIINPQLAIETTFVANSSMQPDFVGAGGASIPIGLYVQHEQVGDTAGNNAYTHSIMAYAVNNAVGDNDVIGVSGRAYKSSKAGNIGDAAGVWGSAYQYSQEDGGVMALEGAIYQNVPGSIAKDRLGVPGSSDWSVSLHLLAASTPTGSPATAAIAIDANTELLPGSFGYWNGIIIDRSSFHGVGVTGTVGINCGSWNETLCPQYGIKFGSTTDAHIYSTKNLTFKALSSIFLATNHSNTSVFADLGTGPFSNLAVRSLNTSNVVQAQHLILLGSNGFVGLGLPSNVAPNQRLTVSGNISADGNVYITNVVSASALVLTSLPTLSSGLPSGSIWRDVNDNNALRIVP